MSSRFKQNRNRKNDSPLEEAWRETTLDSTNQGAHSGRGSVRSGGTEQTSSRATLEARPPFLLSQSYHGRLR